MYSFVPRLYSVCIPFVSFGTLVPLGFCFSLCTPLYSCVLRLYSFVPLGMPFPLSFCTPFVFVCTPTPFGEYNTIKKREEYKSTKACKFAPSIVLVARWPSGINTARAVAVAPVALHALSRASNQFVPPSPQGVGARLRIPPFFPSYTWFPIHNQRLEILAKRTKPACVGREDPQ